jgi:exosortase sorting signal-containing protein
MRRIIGLAMVACLFAVPAAWGAEILYGADGAGGNLANLYILDPATGAIVSTVGPIGFAVTGLAIHPVTGVLYGSTGQKSPNAPHSLIRINRTTGQGTLVGSYGLGTQTMADLTFTSDGTLYGWLEPGSDCLHTINLATGQATPVGACARVGTFGSGLAADASNTIYLAGRGDTGELMTINRTTGQATTVATLTGSTENSVAALAFSSAGVLFGVVLDEGQSRTAILVTINKATGQLTVVGPTVDNLDAIVFVGPAGPTHPIPTLSEVAVIMMAAMLGGMALLTLHRRGRRPQAI